MTRLPYTVEPDDPNAPPPERQDLAGPPPDANGGQAPDNNVPAGQFFMSLWELAGWIEPHSARPCGGMGHIALLGVVALVFVAALRFRYAASAARIDLARRMVERGMTPPADIFSSSARNDLRRGLVLRVVGCLLTDLGALLLAVGLGLVAERRVLRGARHGADHDLAGVDADPQLQRCVRESRA